MKITSVMFFWGLIIFSGYFFCVRAALTATVAATVTAQNVSVSVTDGTVSYSTLSLGSSMTTATSDGDSLDDSQTVHNDGNIAEDFNIRGSDSSGGWTLAASPGAEQYSQDFCVSTCDTSPTWTALTTSNSSLTTNVAAAGTQVFDLRIRMPTSTAIYTSQSVDITIQASAH